MEINGTSAYIISETHQIVLEISTKGYIVNQKYGFPIHYYLRCIVRCRPRSRLLVQDRPQQEWGPI